MSHFSLLNIERYPSMEDDVAVYVTRAERLESIEKELAELLSQLRDIGKFN